MIVHQSVGAESTCLCSASLPRRNLLHDSAEGGFIFEHLVEDRRPSLNEHGSQTVGVGSQLRRATLVSQIGNSVSAQA